LGDLCGSLVFGGNVSPAVALLAYLVVYHGNSERAIYVSSLKNQAIIIPGTKTMEIDVLKEKLQPLFKEHKIVKAILFGSLARGEMSRRSDVDLILIQETQKRFLDRYDDLLLELGQVVKDRAVDILIYTPQELEQIKDRPFIRQALKEGITLYEHIQKPP
jgi:predicted nucleotidyltransferase